MRMGFDYSPAKRACMRTRVFLCVLATVLALPAGAHIGAAASGNPASGRSTAPAAAMPVPADVLPLLTQIQATARTTTADVSLLSVRKWKVGNDVKDDAQAKAEAIQR